jgi:hypothetical protein
MIEDAVVFAKIDSPVRLSLQPVRYHFTRQTVHFFCRHKRNEPKKKAGSVNSLRLPTSLTQHTAGYGIFNDSPSAKRHSERHSKSTLNVRQCYSPRLSVPKKKCEPVLKFKDFFQKNVAAF